MALELGHGCGAGPWPWPGWGVCSLWGLGGLALLAHRCAPASLFFLLAQDFLFLQHQEGRSSLLPGELKHTPIFSVPELSLFSFPTLFLVDLLLCFMVCAPAHVC